MDETPEALLGMISDLSQVLVDLKREEEALTLVIPREWLLPRHWEDDFPKPIIPARVRRRLIRKICDHQFEEIGKRTISGSRVDDGTKRLMKCSKCWKLKWV